MSGITAGELAMQRIVQVVGWLTAIAIMGACNPTSIDSLPFWYADITGTVTSASDTPVSGATVHWNYYPEACGTGEPAISTTLAEVDDQGTYSGRIQVEQDSGCFEFSVGVTHGGEVRTATEVVAAAELDLRQRPPYATSAIDLVVP